MALVTTAVLLFDSRLHSTTDPPPRDRLLAPSLLLSSLLRPGRLPIKQTDNQRCSAVRSSTGFPLAHRSRIPTSVRQSPSGRIRLSRRNEG